MLVVVELLLYLVVALLAFVVGLHARRVEADRARLVRRVGEPASHVEPVSHPRPVPYDWQRDR